MDVIFGIHAVEEALKARKRGLEYVCILKERHDGRMQRLINDCRAAGVSVRFESREQLTRLAKTSNHQGVVAVGAETQYNNLDQLLAKRRGGKAFLLVLDGVEDPHNLGALLRTADAVGVDGVVIPERRAVGVNATVVKASAGASEHVPVAKVTNIGRTVDELKEKNIWTVGVDERGAKRYDEIDYSMDLALVLGGEGGGLHEKVRLKCDFVVKIPMHGKVSSLNVSVAGAVVMYEAARQRGFKTR
ncbi:MAG: 23S rRNA (guanosine(2251)-2'-O)-methyltransferase RlmB [Acidobacteriales bacterium]|nr:23S rRNA (guanosine(2251)-2'-O)-methyltransferase RlmB [Terriglobales bacterium]